MGSILLLLSLGISLLIAVPVIASLIRERQRVRERLPDTMVPVNLTDNENGVIVSEGRGHLVFINDKARAWFGMNGNDPNLETLAELVQPPESFIELFGQEGRASFRLGKRRIEATSHHIPREVTPQLVVVLRELVGPGMARGERDPGVIMNVVSEITQAISGSLRLDETLNAILNSIADVIPYDTGEITLWEQDLQILRPLGRGGAMAHPYYERFEATDGVYHLDDSFSGWLARYRQPLLVADVNARPDVRAKIADYPFLSYIGIPLSIGERFIGTLEMASTKRAAFDHEDLALLQAVSGQAAIAIENARLYQTQAERVAELSGLQEIAAAMGSFSEPRQMFAQLVSRISGLMNSDIVGILLLDPITQTLVGQTPFAGVPDSVAALFRIPLAQDVRMGTLWQREWWYTNDAKKDETLAIIGIQKVLEPLGVARLLLMPMDIGDRRIGLIMVANKRDNTGYTEDDMRLMAVFASQTAIVVENARLYNEQNRQMGEEARGLEPLQKTIGLLDDENALDAQITERIARLMNVQMCGLMLFSADENKLLAQDGFIGLDPTILPYYEVEIPPNSRARDYYTSEKPWIVNEVDTDKLAKETGIDSLARMTDIRHTLIAPLRSGDRQFGVLQLANKLNGQRFNNEDVEKVTEFTGQASQLLAMAREYQDVRRRAREADGLRQIAEIAGAGLSLDDTIRRISEIMANVLQSTIACIALLDEGTAKLVLRPEHTYGMPTLTEPFIIDIYDPTMQGSVAISRRSFLSNDIPRDSRVLPIYRAFCERFGIVSSIQVPLVINEKSIGELSICNKPTDYTRDDLRLVRSIAVQVAEAFERSRLYRSTDADLRARVEELDSLARVSGALNETIDLERILDVIRLEAQRTTGAKLATVVLVKDKEEWLDPETPVMDRRIGEGKGRDSFYSVELQTIRENELVTIQDYNRSVFETNPGTRRSSLAAPISYGGQVRGVIHLASEIPGYFTERGINFVRSLAAQASLAVGNSIRYREQITRNDLLKQRADQISQIFEISRLLRQETNIEAILDAVANAVAETVGFKVVLISVIDAERKVRRRVAQAGLPLTTWSEIRDQLLPLDSLQTLMLPQYQISGSYLLPGEKRSEWLAPATEVAEVIEVSPENKPVPGSQLMWHPRDVMLVPFRDSNGVINGLMSVDEPRDGRRPTRQTIEALEIFANQAAFAIENFELLQALRREADATRRERDRLATLHTVASELQRAPDVPARLQIIANSIRAQGWGRVSITLRDANLEPRDLITAGYRDEEREKLREVLLPGIVWRQRLADADFRKYRVGGAYYLRHIDPWVTENKLMAGMATSGGAASQSTLDLTVWHPLDVIYLPIYGLDQSRLVGIISMDSPIDGKPPTEAAMRPIELFAAQAASAIENTRLIEERIRAAEQETRLNAVMEAVSSTLDTNEIILSMARGLGQLMPFNTMSVGLLDWSDANFETQEIIQSDNQYSIQTGETLPITQTALGRAYEQQTGRVYRQNDLTRSEELTDLAAWNTAGEQVVMVVPMIAGGRSVGALHIGATTGEVTNFDSQLPLVQRMANLTAVAIENARLYIEAIDRERFAASVGRIGQAINELMNLPDLLSIVCSEVMMLLDAEGALIYTEEGEFLVNKAAEGEQAAQFLNTRVPINDNSTLIAAIFHEKGGTYVNDYATQTRYRPTLTEITIQAALAVPLLREDRAVGVLALYHTDPEDKFIPPDIERAGAFAVQAAIAIERAALESNLQERASELSTLTQITGALTSTLDADALARMVIEQAGRLLRYDTATLWLRRGEKLVIRAAAGYPNVDDLLGVEVDIADSALFREITSRAQPVLNIPDVTNDPRFVYNPDRATRSWMGVALNSKGALTGLLVLEANTPNFYSETQETLSLAFANQAAVALENAQLFQQRDLAAQENTNLYQETRRRAAELNQQAQRLTLLNRVSSELAQTLDIENAFEVTLRELVRALGTDGGVAIMLEPGSKSGRLIIEHPRGDHAPHDIFLPLVGVPAFDEAKKALQPVGILDISSDPRIAPLRPFLDGRGTLSALVIPLLIGGQVIGAVLLETSNEYHLFTPDEIEIAQTIAAQAAVAVQNANLFEASSIRTRELETLFEATQATSASLNLDEVIKNATMQMIPALMVDACTILLLDDVENLLEVRGDMQVVPEAAGALSAGRMFSLSDFPRRAEAMQNRQSVALYAEMPDLDSAEKQQFIERGVAARLLLPMIARDQPIGLIIVEYHGAGRQFDNNAIRLARALTTQTSIAIDNARLQTETTNKLNELFVINEMSTALASSIEPAQIYKVLRTQLPLLVDAEVMLLAVYDPENDLISFPVALLNNESVEIPTQSPGDDEISYVIKRRMPLLLAGDDVDEVLHIFGIKTLITKARSLIGVPLLTGDAIMGALALADTHSTRAYGLDDQRVLSTVAAQVAVSIQNSRLFERNRLFTAELEARVTERTEELRSERDRLNTLYNITTGLTASLDMDQVLTQALEMMSAAVGAETGAIMGIDSISTNLIYKAVYDTAGREIDQRLNFAQNEGLIGWVIQSQQSIIVGDVQQDARWLRRTDLDDTVNSAIVALLEANEDILGVVTLYSARMNAFNEGHLRLVTAAAGQIAAAMNNADLYGLIREQAERLGAMVRREQVDSTKNAAIVESIADGIMVADKDGAITQFNNAAERILGLNRRELIGHSIAELAGLYTRTGGESWLERLEAWMSDPVSHRPGDVLQEQLELPDGKIVSVLLSPVNMGDQFLGTVSVFRDITREIEVDRMKSEFVATVSHELRTPMTSIKGYADLLLLGAAGQITEQQQRFLGTIKTNADRLSLLVNELLDISRVDRGVVKLNLQPTNVLEIIDVNLNHIRGRINNERKQLTVKTDVPDTLPLINADFDKLVQIVNNLLDNAFNYTYAGGTVTIGAAAEDGGRSVVIRVTDTGVGISKENQGRVFERFFRGEEHQLVMETSGTGLGLSIVKEYVNMHNGTIWLESEPGKGTTFYVRLPALVS
jgi:PAS domain S-box-containing protein